MNAAAPAVARGSRSARASAAALLLLASCAGVPRVEGFAVLEASGFS